MKGMWVGYDVGCTMGLTCGHGAWQIDRQSSGSMWNSYSFQPVGQWMSYSFTDLGAEGCCCSLNALLQIYTILALVTIFVSYDKSPLISTGNSNVTHYLGPYIYSCMSALWWHHRALYILLNICPGNGLVLPSTKLLPGQMLTWQYM